MCATKRPGVTRHTMIETALRLLDDVGLDGLTVRRLAAELGVQSPALYWHIRSKQQLLDGMAEAIIVAAGMGPPRDGEPWQDWLARRARAYRRSLLAHRDGARIVAGAAWLSPATIQMFNDELSALVDRGFTPVLALRTIATISQYVNGFVLLEQAKPREPAENPADPFATLAGLLDGDASAPLLVAIREGGTTTGDDAFEHGLRTLIEGTTATLNPQRMPE
ncbi:TetR/AcrR family transcriptional regulator C-terminal domain-containing protein [Amycolatopsis sp. MtRt-6]|uniref:TetR/AcrR family transcriptional regulator C-terminal domain-containing protein n=1 Tax=Amycolatopsis sp. MtRt-6 TaxID=2792782 RepID=UPI001A8E9366|nr:TetR/AcrR family transcriptional regulator C-terminal domain-containing protein [Amycolatopsis sp. MtRt-6]